MNKVLVLLSQLLAVLFFSLAAEIHAGDGTWSVEPGVGNYSIPLYPGEIKNFTCTVDGVDTLWSNAFTLGKYDGVYWGTPADTVSSTWNADRHPFRMRASVTSASGSPDISAWLEGNFVSDSTDANWAVVDTLFESRTAETLVDWYVDINNQKYPYYRVKVQGLSGSATDSIFDLDWQCYQNDGN